MGYYNYYSNEDRVDNIRRESDSYLRSSGFVRNEFGHYEDPDDVTRTGAWVDPTTGRINRDM